MFMRLLTPLASLASLAFLAPLAFLAALACGGGVDGGVEGRVQDRTRGEVGRPMPLRAPQLDRLRVVMVVPVVVLPQNPAHDHPVARLEVLNDLSGARKDEYNDAEPSIPNSKMNLMILGKVDDFGNN